MNAGAEREGEIATSTQIEAEASLRESPRPNLTGRCHCTARDCVSPLTPEELDALRKEMVSLAMSDARKDELIHIIDNIVISFVDQAMGTDPVQLSLSVRANKQFQIDRKNGNPDKYQQHIGVHPVNYGTDIDSEQEGR
jgi:hypothetical protein